MKRVMVAVCFYLANISIFAQTLVCPRALPTDDPNFCSSFKTAAICHCTSSGLPASMCQDMTVLYNRMLSVFGSLQRACEYQQSTTPQDCMDNWNCYRLGGIDSHDKLCNSNQNACA